MDRHEWPYLSKYDEWSIMRPDRRRKRFPHRAVIAVLDSKPTGVADQLKAWADFCYDNIGAGGRETYREAPKPWKWIVDTVHSRTSAHTIVIFAFPTEVELIMFKMGVMHG